jgi:hypothetical protein
MIRGMDELRDHVYFEEAQRFARWIRVTVMMPVAVLGSLGLALAVAASPAAAAATGAVAVGFLLLAVPTLAITLVTTVDTQHLHLRLDPLALRVPFLPPRVNDIALDEITHCEVRRYRALRDREYWGNHFWGLGSAFRGGAYLYVMSPSVLSGRGVQVELRTGERILVGSRSPEALMRAIARARHGSV